MSTTANPTLDTFTKAYIIAALWSSTDDHEEPLDSNYSADDLAPETLQQMITDCQKFQSQAGELIKDDLERAGHDFWLTRNGHGSGFWDGDWEIAHGDTTVGNVLTDLSKKFKECNLYVANGKVYII